MAFYLTRTPAPKFATEPLHLQDQKLVMQGAAPNEEIKNEMWNAIKAVDPGYGDLACEVSIDSTLPVPAPKAQAYTAKAVDSLSKIAKQFYGDANQYMRIFDANRDQLDDPNRVQIGMELKIPAA
jgi:nucleoid-associated protein YgaU